MALNGFSQAPGVFNDFIILRRILAAFALALVSLLASSCGTDSLQGRVVLSGSSTLAPLATQAVALWGHDHPQVEARVEAIGSDAGLDRLIRYGEAEFALVSRPLDDRDRSLAGTVGKDLIEIPIAWDAVCFVVPASNTWAAGLSSRQVTQALTSAKLWSDLDPQWPSVPIHRFVMGPKSGTTDMVSQRLLGGNKNLLFSASDLQASEDDQIVARAVAKVDGAVGYLGWTTERGRDKSLRVLALDGILPDPETIRNRSYALPRQLWLVTFRQILAKQPAARSFLNRMMEHIQSLTDSAGLVALSAAERAAVEVQINKIAIP